VAEAAGKKPWAELVRERLIEPLEMKGAATAPGEIPKGAERARGHRLAADGTVEPMPAYEPAEPNPSASMSATARDLAAWLQFQVADGVAPSGNRLVSAKPLLETRTPQNLMRLEGNAKRMFPDTVQTSYAMGGW
jgi:CubicO group peptidase (beta-lactamase class C family)